MIYVSDTDKDSTKKTGAHTHQIPMILVRSPRRNVVVDESVSILKRGPGMKSAWYNAATPYTFKAKVTNCACEKTVENELLLLQKDAGLPNESECKQEVSNL